jgi:phosphoserine phosphatase RsbU/P
MIREINTPFANEVPALSEQTARRELRKLLKAQQRLLPVAAPAVPHFRVALQYRPALDTTGDYYDFIHRPDGKTACFIGDGAGHGPTACMLLAMMRTIFRTHPTIHQDPATTLSEAGKMLATLIPMDMFMSGLYLLFDGPESVEWASAGNFPPMRILANGEIDPIVDCSGIPLGIRHEKPIEYTNVKWKMAAGERLLLFTDGLIEARDILGRKFGRKRIETHWQENFHARLEESLVRILAQAEIHLDNSDFDDDFTMIAVESAPELNGGVL